jgi:hypothetical protein
MVNMGSGIDSTIATLGDNSPNAVCGGISARDVAKASVSAESDQCLKE